jgi:dipeptidyl aminopeptidase/acylaminoacyl peptidase
MHFERITGRKSCNAWSTQAATCCGVLFFALVIAASGALAAKRRLAVEDHLALESVGAPQISPDGQWVAYAVGSIDAEEDAARSSIWRVARAGGVPLQMTAEGSYASSPRWSPDGKFLSFLSARGEEQTQVWALNRLGGEAQPLTSAEQGVWAHEWSPDGTRLVLVVQDSEKKAAGSDGAAAEAPDKPKPWVIDRMLFKMDGVGYLDRRRTHLYIFELGSKELTQLTGGDFDDSSPSWSPDGQSIAFVSNRSEDPDANYNTDVWLARADKPSLKRTPRQLTTVNGADHSPTWSPDGKRIAYVSMPNMDEYSWAAMEQIAVASVETGESKILTQALDRRVNNPRFSTDGTSIYFNFDDQRSVPLGRVGVGGGAVERVLSGKRSVDNFAIGRDGKIVALVSDVSSPGNLFAVESGGLRKLTNHNDALLSGIELADVESVSFASPDGTEVQGFIYKPPGFRARKRYPTLLQNHGGPWSQFDYRFNFDAEIFAAHGYVVVLTNPRGSTGRGSDYRKGTWRTWGIEDTQDAIAGVDHAIKLGYADPERLGVGGWSYGGILTNYVITQSDRFKAAVSGAADALLVSNYGQDLWHRWWEREFGLPWENRALWEERSSFNKVDKIVTPTLWMGGEKDWNVPISNSEQMYLAMKRMGRETLLVVYPDQGHGIELPSFRTDIWQRQLAWYDKYLAK